MHKKCSKRNKEDIMEESFPFVWNMECILKGAWDWITDLFFLYLCGNFRRLYITWIYSFSGDYFFCFPPSYYHFLTSVFVHLRRIICESMHQCAWFQNHHYLCRILIFIILLVHLFSRCFMVHFDNDLIFIIISGCCYNSLSRLVSFKWSDLMT